jgi:hypothetical protein
MLRGLPVDSIRMQMERAAENKLWVMRNIGRLRQKYGDQFVACDNGRVLVSGESDDEVFRKLKERKIDLSTVVIEFIPKNPLIWLL